MFTMTSTVSDGQVQMLLEHTTPEEVGVDPASGAMPDRIAWCANALHFLAHLPDRVTLVVTGDMDRSVRERPAVPAPTEVAARELAPGDARAVIREDGRIDVLVPAGLFVEDGRGKSAAWELVTEEGLHVHAVQRVQDRATPWRARLVRVAERVVQDYQSERALGGEREDPSLWTKVADLPETLRAWGSGLVSVMRMMAEPAPGDDVLLELERVCGYAWEDFALAAADAVSHGRGAELPAVVARDPLWERMVGGHWERFVELLAPLPAGTGRVRREQVPGVEEVATLFQEWVETVGLRCEDLPDGQVRLSVTKDDIFTWSR